VNFRVEPLSVFIQKKDISYDFEPFLFNIPEHLSLQNCNDCYVFWGEKKNKIHLLFNLFIKDECGLSPYQMAFGGIEGSKNLHYKDILEFIEFFLSFCKQTPLHNLKITFYPFSYHAQINYITSQILLLQGFEISKSELTHFINISSTNFEEILHLSEKRKLKKCIQAGFTFEKLEKFDIDNVYGFIKDCRIRRNHPISMSLETFRKTVVQFKDKYFVFVVKHNEQIIALTVAIVINQDILYNFYPADHAGYLVYSPIVMLMQGLYKFCQENQFRLLDLGISTENSNPNLGLIRFKENLGSQSCLKLSFYKTFN
jgi:hypothetical protein